MNAKHFRNLASMRYAQFGSKGALAFLVFAIIVGISSPLILIVEGPLALGFCIYTMEVQRGNEDLSNIFAGFKSFLTAFLAFLLQSIFIVLWTMLFYIPGMIKAYAYSMTMYIIADNPEISANDAITESRRMMDGYKWRLFCLQLSYIGWILLSFLTFGILLFWIYPKMEMAKYEFYLQIKRDRGMLKEETEQAETQE